MSAEAAQQIRQERDTLSRLDCIGGDGDHGTTMMRDFEKFEESLGGGGDAPLETRLKDAGWSVLGVDGGASSAILGPSVAGLGDTQLGYEAGCAQRASSLAAGLRTVAKQTKAQPGDLVEPQINTEGVHMCPFDLPCPVDVRFLTVDDRQQNIELLRPLFRHLGKNCDRSIQILEAARICGMSESHFMSLFKRVTGLSFVTYLNRFRIERAQALLIKTDESVANISQQVGFCDQSYFGKVFRRVVGMTPATYRRRARSGTPADRRRPDHRPPRHLETGVTLSEDDVDRRRRSSSLLEM